LACVGICQQFYNRIFACVAATLLLK